MIEDLKTAEKKQIIEVLRLHEGNKLKTAEALGITRKTLYNKLELYGIHVNKKKKKAP